MRYNLPIAYKLLVPDNKSSTGYASVGMRFNTEEQFVEDSYRKKNSTSSISLLPVTVAIPRAHRTHAETELLLPLARCVRPCT
jgi:hypothetical protein